MSTTIDEKVVEMRFDNKQFENNVQTTLSSLGKLKQSLNLSGASKGLDDVGRAASRIDMSGLSNAVETVRAKFSAMQVMGITALTNITNSAINAGKKIVSALTIDPIKAGFSEYETQINAVQTILANTESKGTTIDDVNKALDTLNTYADKTIYNFTEMTRNIGTFTAAGVDLNTSVDAIQGIANLAAVSGSTSQQASTAMYQLSQALSSGTVKLQDWNSVVNAGMGGQVFQDALKRTAEAHGVNVDKMIKKNGSFRESLKEGWITSEILTETLSQFTMAAEEGSKEWEAYKKSLKEQGYSEKQAVEILKMANTATNAATKVKTLTQLWDTLKESAQSGWTQSWEIIVGNFEEAKVLFTEISDTIGAMIGESAEARNAMLQGWKDLGGRTALIDALRNAFEGVMSIITPIKDAFADIFPPITSKQLFNLTEGLKKLTEKLKISDETADKIKRTFKGVFSIFSVGVQAIKALFGGFVDLVGLMAPARAGLLDFTANLGDGLVAFSEFIKSSDVFNKIIKKITGTLGFVIEKIRNFRDSISEAFAKFTDSNADGISQFADNVKTRFEPFTKIGEGVKKVFEGIGKVIDKLAPIFYGIADAAGKAFSAISDAILGADFNTALDIVNTGLLGGIAVGITKFIKSLTGVTDGAGGFLENIVGILDGVKGSLETWQASLKSNTLLKIAGAIGILAVALVALSLIDSEKLGVALGAITGLFADLFGSMAIFQKLMGKDGFKSMDKVTTAMIGISAAVLILAVAMKKIADLEWSEVIKGLTAISILSAVLVSAAKKLSQTSGKLFKGAAGLVVFAGAILVLAEGVGKLGAIDLNSLIKGLGAVGVLMLEIAAFLKLAKFDGISVSKGAGLIALAVAINILAEAVSKFSGMNIEQLGKGLGAVGAVLLELAIFTRLVGNSKGIISTSVGMVILGAAMLIFAESVSKMSKISWEEIGKGLATMAGVLILVTASLRLMPKNMISIGVGLVAVAAALIILAQALTSMSGMSWEEIGKGLAVLGGSLTIITLAMLGMKKALPGAAALLVVSAALTILVPILQKLGSMSLAEIGKSLLAMAGAFTVLGVAGYLLGPITPAILGLSAAIALFGVGCLAAGAGVLAFSAGLAALSVSGAAGAAALVTIVTALIGLIPLMIQKLGEGLIAFCNVIADGAPAIGEAITAVVLAIIDTITGTIPPLIECLNVLLTALLNFLVSFIPNLVDAGMKLLLGLLKGIADNIKDVTTTAIKIITEFINGIADGIPDVIQSGINLVLSFINGMADGIRNNTDPMIDAVDNLMDSVVYAIKQWLGHFVTKGKQMIQNIIDGVKKKIEDAKTAVKDLISDVVDGISDTVSDFLQAGKDLIQGLIDGILDKASTAVETVKRVGGDILNGIKDFLGIESPSKEFIKVGKYCDEGLIAGLKAYANRVTAASKDVGRGALDAMSDSLVKVSDLIDSGLDSELTIRPVMDLSNVESGMKALGGMMSEKQTLTIDTRAVGGISTSMQKLQNRQNSNSLLNAVNGLRKDMSNMSSNVYQINGVSYSEGSDVAEAIKTIVRNTKIEGRS